MHQNTKHGHSPRNGKQSKTYMTWAGMKGRCTNESNTSYKWYGAKGIKVCDRWQEFTNFLEDMGEIKEGMTIDRIDSSKDYSPENCRLVTTRQQAVNIGKCTRDGKEPQSKYKGVTKAPWKPEERPRWVARINVNGTRKHLGTFMTEEEAAIAYDEAVKEYHEGYGYLNFKNIGE